MRSFLLVMINLLMATPLNSWSAYYTQTDTMNNNNNTGVWSSVALQVSHTRIAPYQPTFTPLYYPLPGKGVSFSGPPHLLFADNRSSTRNLRKRRKLQKKHQL